MVMEQTNSLALEKARPQVREKKVDLQVKLRARPCPVNLPGQENLRDSRPEQAMCSLLPPARPCPYWRGPDPFAYSQSTPAGRKCNRVGRCGAGPISGAALVQRHAFDRCPKQRNQGGVAGYDNRSNHWRRRYGCRAQSFPISARDKHRCLLRPFADRDVRFADSG